MISFLEEIEKTVIGGDSITREQAEQLARIPDEMIDELAAVALRVRRHFCRDKVDLCSIINARSGRCGEDCKFCAQSTRHSAGAPVYPMKSVDEIVATAKQTETNGAHRFCIVTSGEALDAADFAVVLEAVSRIKAETGLKRCASVGRLTAERARELKEAGLNRYHHNVETARGFFPAICSTHTYEDKLETITHLKDTAIETCVGGILNIGESPDQRLEFAFEIRGLQPDSVPLNFLNPRSGTPLAGRPPLAAREAAKFLAIFRLILPRASIRLAGGRRETFKDQPGLPFASGVNALLVGDLLTTDGPPVESDLSLLDSLGFDLAPDDENS